MKQSPVVMSRDEILRRARAEYLEMPGLRLTRAQARRLWGLDDETCADVLDSLTEDKFLQRRHDGTYARLTDGAATLPPPRMAKAGLPTFDVDIASRGRR